MDESEYVTGKLIKKQMKKSKRHQQNLINHHLSTTATLNTPTFQLLVQLKQTEQQQKQQQLLHHLNKKSNEKPLSPSSPNELRTSALFVQQQQQRHNIGSSSNSVSQQPINFAWYELALPLTILAFIIFGIFFILGFIIYKLLKYCLGEEENKKKRRLTKDNIYYQTVRRYPVTPIRKNKLFYRYRFVKRSIEPGMEPGIDDGLGGGGAYETQVGFINEELKSKKSPPPSPLVQDEDDDDDDDGPEEYYDEELMQTPEAQISNPNSPNVLVAMQYPIASTISHQVYPIQPFGAYHDGNVASGQDEINSNADRSALQFLQQDVCCVQPIMRGRSLDQTIHGNKENFAAGNKENTAPGTPPIIHYGNLNSPKILRNLETNVLKEQCSPRQTTDSSTSSPLFTACEVISGTHIGSASRFSFSPKNVKELNSSPLLPSAGLRHGNYFKFPEVDVFTPTNKQIPREEQNNNMNVNNNKDPMSLEGTPLIENLQISDVLEEYKTPKMHLDDDNILTNDTTNKNVTIQNRNLLSEHRTRTRRVRLKSISLDSDGAKLVEENIGIPVEELVEMANPLGNVTGSGEATSSVDIQYTSAKEMKDPKLVRSNTGRSRKIKNIHNLTINVEQPDTAFNSFEFSSDITMMTRTDAVNIPPPPQTPKTPIQKAASLDSEPTYLSLPNQQHHAMLHHHQQQMTLNSSVSVPSTPKRQPFSTAKHKFAQKMYTTANKSYGCLRQPISSIDSSASGSNNNLYFYSKCNRKLRSYDENISSLMASGDKLEDKIEELDDNDPHCIRTHVSTQNLQQNITGMSSLQVAKFNTLSVSNNNLKTLPEVQMVNDFSSEDGNGVVVPIVSGGKSDVTPTVVVKSKSSILQRRGSNHSLTLNIDGSISNLSRGLSLSNYSLGAMQGSNYNLNSSNYNLATNVNPPVVNVDPATAQQIQIQQQQQNIQIQRSQRKLLQRRGSNTSLSLNIQGSNNSLNRFNSHNSLNILQQERKKGLLERRDSNTSLTLNIGERELSISNCNLNRNHHHFTSSLSNVNRENTQNRQMLVPNQSSRNNQEQSESHESNTRKYLSSENLTNHFTIWSKYSSSSSQYNENQTPYGSMDDFKNTTVIRNIDIDDDWTDETSTDMTGMRSITTKPLSPQSTSEDFKIYLANIQFLQNASNVLNEKQLNSLNEIFQKSYNSITKDVDPILGRTMLLTKEQEAEEQDQKHALIKLHHEFWDLPTNYQEKPMVFGSQAKNRYKTILPNEHSRVMLDAESGTMHKPYINANYIKGPDFTQNCYIATQGPMQNTIYEFWLMVYQNMRKVSGLHNTNDDEMIVEGQEKIAMLTDFIENNRHKCAMYFPKEINEKLAFCNTNHVEDSEIVIENYEKIMEKLLRNRRKAEREQDDVDDDEEDDFRPDFNFFLVRNVDIRCKNGYSIRKLKVIYSYNQQVSDGGEESAVKQILIEFPVFHYWFPDWPDHRSPEDIDVLLDMSLDLLYGDCDIDFPSPSKEISNPLIISDTGIPLQDLGLLSPSKSQIPLPIIHCSAGIGRTGCLAAILNGLRQMRLSLGTETTVTATSEITTTTSSVDILGIVCNLRLQRGGMVQNSEQYELIHRALCLYHQRLNLEQEKHLSTQL